MGLNLNMILMFLLSDLKVDETEIFDGVKECSVKRAQARQKCETKMCSLSTPDIKVKFSCQEEKFIDHYFGSCFVEKFTNLIATE